MHVNTHIYTCPYIHTLSHTLIHTYTLMHAHTYIHTHTHTYMHTHTHTPSEGKVQGGRSNIYIKIAIKSRTNLIKTKSASLIFMSLAFNTK